MPASRFAILIHRPSEAAWLRSSHSSQSAAEGKACCGRSSSAPTANRLSLVPRRRRSSMLPPAGDPPPDLEGTIGKYCEHHRHGDRPPRRKLEVEQRVEAGDSEGT